MAWRVNLAWRRVGAGVLRVMTTFQKFDERTALVVVDVQNDFADPTGSLYVKGGEDVVPLVNDLIEAARGAGALVVYTADWHPATTPHFQKDGGTWPVHCVRDTWGAELHPRLVLAGAVVRKGTGGEDGYSGFTMRDPERGVTRSTELELLLRQAGIERVVVVGLATDWCVKETALDARKLGFATTVIEAATRAVNLDPNDGARAVETLCSAGVEIA